MVQLKLLPDCYSDRRVRGVQMRCSAHFSVCNRYRFELWRRWDDTKPYANFILLNPSTATAETDDPTMLRAIGFAMDWGFGGMCTTNIFAFRATDPKCMKREELPIGLGNDQTIERIARDAGVVVCGWGTHGAHLDRGKHVTQLLFGAGVKMRCLAVTKDGFPGHPLYLPQTSQLHDFP